jgi:hypothetical protein
MMERIEISGENTRRMARLMYPLAGFCICFAEAVTVLRTGFAVTNPHGYYNLCSSLNWGDQMGKNTQS